MKNRLVGPLCPPFEGSKLGTDKHTHTHTHTHKVSTVTLVRMRRALTTADADYHNKLHSSEKATKALFDIGWS